MAEEGLIPVAFCGECGSLVPVIIDKLDIVPGIPEAFKGLDLEVVICPVCLSILNNSSEDVEIEWYDAEGLKEVGYEILNDGESGTGAAGREGD